nr:5567_t:CDS:2 [Entrophospora candida]
MDKPSHNTVDSVGEAFKPFASLITTANAVINQIVDIFENAEYNKKICNVFLVRVDVATIHIKNLERRKEENEYLFRDVDYYKHFVRFTTILTEIKTFLNDITHLPGYNKYNSARNFEEISKRELVTYDDGDEKMLKLQEEYSNIFIGGKLSKL